MILDQPIFRSLVYIYHFYRRINRKLVRRVLESNHRNYKQITERLLFLNTFNFLRDCQLIREKYLCQLKKQVTQQCNDLMRVCRGQQHFNGTTTIVILKFVLDIRRSADINGISHCLQLFMLRNVAFRTIHRNREMTNTENNFMLCVLCPFKKFPFLKSGCYDEFCNKDEM